MSGQTVNKSGFRDTILMIVPKNFFLLYFNSFKLEKPSALLNFR